MRKIMALLLAGVVRLGAFSQEAPGDESASPPLPAAPETREEPAAAAADPSPLLRYLTWARPFAERKDFVLSAVFGLWTPDAQGIGEELVTLHWSFLPFTAVGGGLNASGLFGQGFYPQSLTLTHKAGFVLPLTPRLRMFGDLTLETGIGEPSALSAGALAIAWGYDAGFTMLFDTDFGIEITYKGLWRPDGSYVNALGFGWVWNFWL
jgi:hypothetical protein